VIQETFTLPQYSETGAWTVVSLWLADTAGNETNLDGADAVSYFTNRGFPYQVTVTGTADLLPPALTEFDFTPKVVNITAAPQDITFTGRFVDNLSGMDYPTSVRFRRPSGAQEIYPYFYPSDRISGTATNAVIQETFTLPQYSEAGVWTVVSLWLADTAGNETNLDGADAVSYFTNHGFPYQFVVVEDVRLVPSIPSNQTFQLNWPSISGVKYTVEWKANLATTQWNSTADINIGNGGILSWQTGIPGVVQRFFRIVVLPP
jgi:hypothetical protein